MVETRTGLLVLALLATPALAPIAQAHNPAATLHAPVAYGDNLLVVGGEGTVSLIDHDGQAIDRGNLSGMGEVRGGPVVAGETAAIVRQVFPAQRPQVVGIQGTDEAWNHTIGGVGDRAWVTARDGSLFAFSQTEHVLELSTDGEIIANHTLPAKPTAKPAPAPGGDWWIPTKDALQRVSATGELADEASFTGRANDVTVEGEAVLLSITHRQDRRGTLMVFDRSLELQWSRSMTALRLGGQPAATEESFVVGTYDPDGARLLGLDRDDGSITFEHRFANTTAAAPASVEGGIAVATTEQLAGFDASGNQTWNVEGAPLLVSPAQVDDLVVASGRENRVVAVHPNGTLAWTYSDGITSPPWGDHHGRTGGSAPAEGEEGEPAGNATSAPGLLAALAAAGLALAARRDS